MAFDIGTGTGVLAAVLARRGVNKVVATDQDPRALACAQDNITQLNVAGRVELLAAEWVARSGFWLFVYEARPKRPQ